MVVQAQKIPFLWGPHSPRSYYSPCPHCLTSQASSLSLKTDCSSWSEISQNKWSQYGKEFMISDHYFYFEGKETASSPWNILALIWFIIACLNFFLYIANDQWVPSEKIWCEKQQFTQHLDHLKWTMQINDKSSLLSRTLWRSIEMVK